MYSRWFIFICKHRFHFDKKNWIIFLQILGRSIKETYGRINAIVRGQFYITWPFYYFQFVCFYVRGKFHDSYAWNVSCNFCHAIFLLLLSNTIEAVKRTTYKKSCTKRSMFVKCYWIFYFTFFNLYWQHNFLEN